MLVSLVSRARAVHRGADSGTVMAVSNMLQLPLDLQEEIYL